MRDRLVRKRWDRQTDSWDQHVWSSEAFLKIQAAILDAAHVQGHEMCADLGSGSGFVTWPMAAQAAHVTAVDISPEMGRFMLTEARARGTENVEIVVCPLQELEMGDSLLDVVVSSYALHHLTNKEKRELVLRCRRWIRPGGRLVFADMMFGRGATAQDRRILVAKARQLLSKGPGGAWRLVKNLTRFGFGLGTERPASPEFWTALLQDAGFSDVEYTPIVGEAGLVVGRLPVKVTVPADGNAPKTSSISADAVAAHPSAGTGDHHGR